ncbi:PREDICTED: purple acid phosphatase 17-like [Nelumbo nucifera]|uniref:Purple acid phosphatase n=1 Tax=Nelumbo nucifera TaxID=4432 RepID=A0A1U8QA63_NELNU|nr:PREDICTED: purple acid phosphatase 17-like [Nelumbo nucifera]
MALFLTLMIILGLCLISTLAELQRLEHSPNADGSLSFLVVGDWGRKGAHNQSEVAHQMGRVGSKLNINFVISTGDNFYEEGLKGVEDTAFEESFTKIYTDKSLQKQWYSVLGNHDYMGDAEAELSSNLTLKDTRWLCLRSYIVNAKIAEFFFIDTTPFADEYFTIDPSEDQVFDWRGVLPRKNYTSNLLKDVESALRASAAKWKIVIGHHPIRSFGTHGDTQELVEQLLPILQANNVDMYMNGHDHCLMRISSPVSPIQFLTSGAGSEAWICDAVLNRDGVKFHYPGQGFISVEMTQTHAKVVFYDVFGKVLHSWSASKKLLHSSWVSNLLLSCNLTIWLLLLLVDSSNPQPGVLKLLLKSMGL